MVECEICKGNDRDVPCAYPSKCLRDQRLLSELKKELSVIYKRGYEAGLGETAKEIDNLKERLKSALTHEIKWQDWHGELEKENKRLKYSLQQCESARKAELGAWMPEAERLRKELVEVKKKADHWESTCHAQWESSKQAMEDCNTLTKENLKLRKLLAK